MGNGGCGCTVSVLIFLSFILFINFSMDGDGLVIIPQLMAIHTDVYILHV